MMETVRASSDTLLIRLLDRAECGVCLFRTGNGVSEIDGMADARALLKILETKEAIAKLLLSKAYGTC